MASKDPKQAILKSVPLFSKLKNRELEQIARLTDTLDVKPGTVLMRQGDTGGEMFVVESGRFTIDRDGATIAESGPGAVIGEIALVSEGPRTATVTAAELSRVFVVSHREFHSLLEVSPQIRSHIFDQLAGRLRTLDPDAVC